MLGTECYAGKMLESFMHFRKSFAKIYTCTFTKKFEKNKWQKQQKKTHPTFGGKNA